MVKFESLPQTVSVIWDIDPPPPKKKEEKREDVVFVWSFLWVSFGGVTLKESSKVGPLRGSPWGYPLWGEGSFWEVLFAQYQ